MIVNSNYNNKINRIGHLKTSNTAAKQQIQQNKNYSPSFTGLGAGLGGFASYLAADILGIIVGVGATDTFFRNKNLKCAKEFGLKVIQKNHSEELKNIEKFTREVILDLRSFKDNKSTKKLAEKVKKSYEKSFDTELFIDKKIEPKKRDANTLVINISTLKKTLDDLFVGMNDQDRYTSIASPYLNTLQKVQNQILN